MTQLTQTLIRPAAPDPAFDARVRAYVLSELEHKANAAATAAADNRSHQGRRFMAAAAEELAAVAKRYAVDAARTEASR